jgi:hypothetical protein
MALLISSLFRPKACMDEAGALKISKFQFFWVQMALASLIVIS